MSALDVDDAGYRKLVGEHAIEFERRLEAAGAKIEMEPVVAGGWRVVLTLPNAMERHVSVAPKMATALWSAASGAGLTRGLVPPGMRTS